jgi:hypothetical protein
MKTIETSYKPPRVSTLFKEGYYRRYVSYDCTDEIIAYLTSYGCVFSPITNEYLAKHKGSLIEPIRASLAVYAYGLKNTAEFGNKLDNALYHSATVLIRHILAENKRYKPINKLVKYNLDDFISLADTIYASGKVDVQAILDSLEPTKYDPSNGWYSRILKNKQNS